VCTLISIDIEGKLGYGLLGGLIIDDEVAVSKLVRAGSYDGLLSGCRIIVSDQFFSESLVI
jgi:hypothetical protein